MQAEKIGPMMDLNNLLSSGEKDNVKLKNPLTKHIKSPILNPVKRF